MRMHWDCEPLIMARQRESADKSDALQTLRAVRRRLAVAKRLECARLQRRFSHDTPRSDDSAGSWRALGFDAAHWDHEPVRGTLHVWSPGFSRSKPFEPPKGGTPNQPRFVASPLSFFRMHWDQEPVRIPLSRPSATLSPHAGGEGRERGRFMESPRPYHRALGT